MDKALIKVRMMDMGRVKDMLKLIDMLKNKVRDMVRDMMKDMVMDKDKTMVKVMDKNSRSN